MHVKKYGYKPTPRFETLVRGTAPRLYIGVELELNARPADSGVSPAARVSRLWQDTRFRHKSWYPKQDSSLTDYGVELVSHPRTLEAWRRYGPSDLAAIRDHFYAPSNGYGLHAHVGRYIYFRDTREQINAEWVREITQSLDEEFILAACRRYGSAYARMRLPNPEAYSYFRYAFVNSVPQNTIEFRGGAATTQEDRFYAFLEFVHSVTMFSLSVSRATLEHRRASIADAYYGFLAQHMSEYSHLVAAAYSVLAGRVAPPEKSHRRPQPVLSTKMAFRHYAGRKRARLLAPILNAVRAASRPSTPIINPTGA